MKKIALKVPSANSLLKVFGNLNATKNASANTVAPKKNAIKISQISKNSADKREKTEN